MPLEALIISPAERAALPVLLTKRLIRRHYVPVADRTLSRWISSGRFPRADIAVGGKIRLWKKASVENWIAEQEKNHD